MESTPTDLSAPRFPVSMKAVIVSAEGVPLLENERREWELPGGKLEPGEDPRRCLAREVLEELSVQVQVGPILDSWLYAVAPGVEVLIVTYLCFLADVHATFRISNEHKSLGLFDASEIADLHMPAGYKRSVAHAFSIMPSSDR